MKFGLLDVAALRYGGQPVVAAYIGSTQVWPLEAEGFAGDLIAASLLAGEVVMVRTADGLLAATSAFTGGLTRNVRFSGDIVSVSAFAGDVLVSDENLFYGSSDAQSLLSAEMAALRGLAGSLLAASILSGTPSRTRSLAGALASLSAVSGTSVLRAANLNGALAAISAASAALNVTASTVAIAYQTTSGDNTTQATYTFASQPFGTASSNRYVLIGIGARAAAARTLNSVTIGGVTATQIRNDRNTAGGNTTVTAWFIAAVPSGSTGTVVVTFSNSMARCGIAVFSLTGLLSTTEVSGATDGTTPYDGTLSVLSGGAVLGLLYVDVATASWTAGLTSHANTQIGASGQYLAVASSLIAVDNASYAVQVTATGANAQMNAAFTSLR